MGPSMQERRNMWKSGRQSGAMEDLRRHKSCIKGGKGHFGVLGVLICRTQGGVLSATRMEK